MKSTEATVIDRNLGEPRDLLCAFPKRNCWMAIDFPVRHFEWATEHFGLYG